MAKLRLGIYGADCAIRIVKRGLHGELTDVKVVCEPDERSRRNAELIFANYGIAVVADFGRLLSSGIDALILSGAADKHAIYAIRALRHGLHILCEPLPAATLDEAFLLERAVRESGRVYALAETYCYRRGILLAREMVRRGDIGAVTYVEGNYVNNIASHWETLTGGMDTHWLNYTPSTFYCTHSIGPMLFATGLRAVRVSGAETIRTRFLAEKGAKNASAGFEQLEFDGGAIGRSLHGNLMGPYDADVKIYGETGSLEVSGERVTLHDFSSGRKVSSTLRAAAKLFKGMKYAFRSDLDNAEATVIACFAARILGDNEAAAYFIDIHRALDMALPGLLAYRSILDGGRVFIVPDLRTDEGREFCRGDRFTTDPRADEKYRLPTNKNRRGTGDAETRFSAALYGKE